MSFDLVLSRNNDKSRWKRRNKKLN